MFFYNPVKCALQSHFKWLWWTSLPYNVTNLESVIDHGKWEIRFRCACAKCPAWWCWVLNLQRLNASSWVPTSSDILTRFSGHVYSYFPMLFWDNWCVICCSATAEKLSLVAPYNESPAIIVTVSACYIKRAQVEMLLTKLFLFSDTRWVNSL